MRPKGNRKGRKTYGRAVCGVVGALLLAAYLSPRGSAGAPPPQDARRLGAGAAVERDIAAGQTHHYELSLSPGQLARLRFEPRTASLSVTLARPGGATPELFELPVAPPATPDVAFVADTPGVYGLEVRLAEQSPPGRYTLRVEELRAAGPDEKGRVEAEQAFKQGAVLQFARGDAGSLVKAVEKYERARALWQAGGERAREAQALGGIGSAYVSLGQPPQAIKFYEQKLNIVRELKDRRQEAYMSENIGLLYYSSVRDKANALAHLTEAARLYGDAGNPDGEARALTHIGKVYLELGATDDERRKSLDHFVRVLGVQRSLHNRYYEGDTLGNLMFALRDLSRPREAIFFGKEAVNVFQEIRSGIADLDADTQKTFVESKEAVYRALAALLISVDRLPEAWQVLNMLKEEEYADFIRRNGGPLPAAGLRVALWSAEEKARKDYGEQAGRLISIGKKLAELRKKELMTEEESVLAKRYQAEINASIEVFLNKYLKKLSGELGKTDYAKVRWSQYEQALGLRENLRMLGSDVVLLYTLVSEEKYYALLVTSELVQPYEYEIKSSDLALKISDFREQLHKSTSCPLASAQELYRILVGPELAGDLERSGAETLMWSLDGPLRYVPVAALHDGTRYLVERYRNSVVTPASLPRINFPPIQEWRGVGFGVSKEHVPLPALPSVPGELSSIFRVTDDAGAEGIIPGQIVLDDDFTKERMVDLLSDLKRKPPIVHIASHFVLYPTSKEKSFLLLGKGERLPLSNIGGSVSFRGVKLLTLSACDTATVGGEDNGIDVEGFANLAQLSGAESIVASLWPVGDDSTQVLMREFYRVHRARPGLTKTEMLRQAQLSLLRGGDAAQAGEGKADCAALKRGAGVASYKHPYFWAPFLLIGNWQ